MHEQPRLCHSAHGQPLRPHGGMFGVDQLAAGFIQKDDGPRQVGQVRRQRDCRRLVAKQKNGAGLKGVYPQQAVGTPDRLHPAAIDGNRVVAVAAKPDRRFPLSVAFDSRTGPARPIVAGRSFRTRIDGQLDGRRLAGQRRDVQFDSLRVFRGVVQLRVQLGRTRMTAMRKVTPSDRSGFIAPVAKATWLTSNSCGAAGRSTRNRAYATPVPPERAAPVAGSFQAAFHGGCAARTPSP